jgi:hypothetical protein
MSHFPFLKCDAQGRDARPGQPGPDACGRAIHPSAFSHRVAPGRPLPRRSSAIAMNNGKQGIYNDCTAASQVGLPRIIGSLLETRLQIGMIDPKKTPRAQERRAQFSV